MRNQKNCKTPDELRRYAHDVAHSPDWGTDPPLWYTALTQADYEAEAYFMEKEDAKVALSAVERQRRYIARKRGVAVPKLKGGRSPTTIHNFWSHVAKLALDDCWEWTANLYKDGYGQMGLPGGKKIRVHRFSWQIHHGVIPLGMCVCHRCDNRKCVNPDHLFLGSHADNTADMMRKLRHSYGHQPGELNGRSKLSADHVREVRQRLATGEPQGLIANSFGVHSSTIYKIAHGLNWRSVIEAKPS